jgi:hypothetical protein
MITEDYVSFETAKLLKEKGFDEKCFYCFDDVIGESRLSRLMICNNSELVEHYYSAPTLQMAMKWLREVHKLCISITPQVTDDDGDGGCLWQFAITSHLEPLSISLELYEQYEEACEVAIRYCLENLI